MRATSLATSVIPLALLAVALAEVVGAPAEGLAVSEPRNLRGQLQLQETRQQRQRLLQSKKERRQARKKEKRRRRRERRRRRREERQRRKEAQQDEDGSPEAQLIDDEAEDGYDDGEYGGDDNGSGGGGGDNGEGDGEDGGDDNGSGSADVSVYDGGDGDENSNRDAGDEDGGDDNGSGGGGDDDYGEADDDEDWGDDDGGGESGGDGADASVSGGGGGDEDSNRDAAGDESSNRDAGDGDGDGSQETMADAAADDDGSQETVADDDDASASSEPRSQTSAECGSLSDWVAEGSVGVSGGRYTFTPGGGRAEMKRVIGRSDTTVFDESLTYSGSVTGMEAGTGVIVFQYHGDGSGTVVKVYYDNRGGGRHENYENGEADTPYEDGSGEPLFDLYVRCNDGNRESGRNLLRAGMRDGDDFTLSMSKDTSGVFDISISGGGSHTCDISGWDGGIYPKFGAYPQGGGSYGNVEAVFNVESYNCS